MEPNFMGGLIAGLTSFLGIMVAHKGFGYDLGSLSVGAIIGCLSMVLVVAHTLWKETRRC